MTKKIEETIEEMYEHCGLKCPYCGYVDKDPNEIFTDMEETIDNHACGRCEKEFIASRTVEFTYTGKPIAKEMENDD